MDLEVGDVVQLKSGSPLMTVENINAEGRISCTWFKDKEIRSSMFNSEMLDKYSLDDEDNGDSNRVNLWD